MYFFFSSRRRHTRLRRDWSSDVCSSDLPETLDAVLDAQADHVGFNFFPPSPRHLGLVEASALAARAASDSALRPVLSDSSPLSELQALEAERAEFYAEVSAAKIDASGDPDEVLSSLIAQA